MSTNQDTGALYGLIVEFDDVPDLMVAVKKVRDQGFKNWDVPNRSFEKVVVASDLMEIDVPLK